MLACTVLLVAVLGSRFADSAIEYKWRAIDFDWPSNSLKQASIKNGSFIIKNNLISGIKIYKDSVYLTIPRTKKGVPSTVNVVVQKDGEAILKPFPSWDMQKVGDCSAIQFAQSFEIDPVSGWMWIIDTGLHIIADPGQFLCPAKLVIYDINAKKVIRVHTFPEAVAPKMRTYLNDIVIHKISGKPAYAYISDTGTSKLVVYDFRKDKSYTFSDKSMAAEQGSATTIDFDHTKFVSHTPINGIALSPDHRYLYYCPLSTFKLYRVPTSVLANENADISRSVKNLGNKVSQTGGMIAGSKSLYYGALNSNAVYKWDFTKDIAMAASVDDVTLKTQTQVVKDDMRMKWVDSFAMDTSGHLWFTVNDVPRFLGNTMDFSATGPFNMFIWKVDVGEKSYM
ncbi:major royal jelly protein 3-like [Haliotis rubra]|uniref:major royal jelly protein 3-like n=1 Tax=Haliotis rubra TaxID=36100 RepID=UPI001EE5A4BC|nr:major royal jelly protein 3-like [Haliotis rubra]